jgi:AbrB family looped-hinge helix DNA binding protein
MTKATIKFLDEKKRRIIIPKEIAEVEDLHEGDYIEIDVRKIDKPKEKT